MSEQRVYPSHFSYVEGSIIKETTNRDLPQNYEDAAGAPAIIKALQKYGFLTRKLLKRNLAYYGHRTIDVAKSLTKMQQQGIIKKYTIFSDISDNISIVCLAEGLRGPSANIYRFDMTDIPYILEHLVIAQWKIALLKTSSVSECLNEYRVLANENLIKIPCLHRFRNKYDRKMYLLAVPTCRTNDPEGLRRFLKTLNDLKTFLDNSATMYRSSQIVIICESMRQIEDVSRMVSRITELSGYYFLYSTDEVTLNDEPLSMLYGAEMQENGNVELSMFSLREENLKEAAGRTAKTLKGKLEILTRVFPNRGAV